MGAAWWSDGDAHLTEPIDYRGTRYAYFAGDVCRTVAHQVVPPN
jgi:hypothetical protein